jgi:pimeloyl-ACP methyl ester carboxylesterase
LKNAKVKEPYIIVAHSIGGFNARLFAGTYPKEVAGIVFVDCSHENQYDFIINKPLKVREDLKNQFGYSKKKLDEIMLSIKKTKEDLKNNMISSEQNLDEQILSAKQVKEIRKKDSLRNIPIVVLSADELIKPSQEGYKQIMKSMMERQKDIASLSNKSKYIFVKNSGHYIQREHPQVVIDAIKEIINKVRK